MRALLPYLVIITLLCQSCSPQNDNSQKTNIANPNNFCRYADKYSLEKVGDFYLVKVFSPWQKAGQAEFTYLLGNDLETVPDSLENIPFIKTPVERVVLMSTTFISLIDALDELPSIAGISGSNYVYNHDLRMRIEEDEVMDVGYDKGLNYELIIAMNPDVLFLYGVEAGVSQTINKLKDLGIPVVMCGDYLEQAPLGRTEWLKFFSVFYDKYGIADNIFTGIAHRYDSIRNIASGLSNAPTVFVGFPWKDTWYIAGGQSYAAQFIKDAGGIYVWSDLQTTEAEPHDLESVYSKILDADIWINAGIAEDLQSILDHDTRFKNLKAWGEGSVYNNNLRINDFGGNDYWESGIIQPDQILNDLVNIFHHGNDSLNYYKRLR